MRISWKLRMAAAQRQVWTGTQLRRLLAERAGLELSSASVSALLTKEPRACHGFRVSHGMTNMVSLSQGKSSWEEDGQRVQGHCPARCSGPGLASSFAGDVPQSEVE
jgi:hypothetical protein